MFTNLEISLNPVVQGLFKIAWTLKGFGGKWKGGLLGKKLLKDLGSRSLMKEVMSGGPGPCYLLSKLEY